MLIDEKVRNGPKLFLINSKHYLVAVVLGNRERPHDAPALWGTISSWLVWFSCTENILLVKGHTASPFYSWAHGVFPLPTTRALNHLK